MAYVKIVIHISGGVHADRLVSFDLECNLNGAGSASLTG